MMLGRLIDILQRADLTPSAVQIADSLWLAAYLPGEDADLPVEKDQPPAPLRNAKKPEPGPGEKRDPITPPPSPPSGVSPPMVGVKVEVGQEIKEAVKTLERFAGSADYDKTIPPWVSRRRKPIRAPLEVVRALRSLARRTSSRTQMILDEEATVHQSADSNSMTLVMRPARERWLDLTIVVDASIDEAIWHDWLDALTALLVGMGAFRDVRAWTMHYDPTTTDSEQIYVQIRNAQARRPQRRHLNALTDAHQRRMILLISDCVGEGWRNSAFIHACYELSRRNIVSLFHLLPPHAWRRTALAHVNRAWVSSTRPVANGSDLQISRLPQEADCLPMPITTLEPGNLSQWARMMSGQSSKPVLAALLSKRASEAPQHPLPPSPPIQRLAYFQLTAAPLAKELAGYLALTRPLTLPIMQLIQQTLLPESTESDMVEVLNSGLLTRWPVPPEHAQPDCYAFPDEIAQALRRPFTQKHKAAILNRVTYLVALNEPTTTFYDFLATRNAKNESLFRTLAPFADVMFDVIQDAWCDASGTVGGQGEASLQRMVRVINTISVSSPMPLPEGKAPELPPRHTPLPPPNESAPVLPPTPPFSAQPPFSGDETAQLIAIQRLRNQGLSSYNQQPLAELHAAALASAAATLIERAAELARSASSEAQKGLQRFRPERLSNAVAEYAEIIAMLERADLVMDSEPDSESTDVLAQIVRQIRQHPEILTAQSGYRQEHVRLDLLHRLVERLKPRLDHAMEALQMEALQADDANHAVYEIEQIHEQLRPASSQRVEIELGRAKLVQLLLQSEQLLADNELEQAEQRFRELLERKDRAAQEFRPRINVGMNKAIQRRAESAVQRKRVLELRDEAQTYRNQQTSEGFAQAIRLYQQILTFPVVRGSSHKDYSEQLADLQHEYAGFLAPFKPLISARQHDNPTAQILELRLLLHRGLRTDEQGKPLEEQLIALRDALTATLLAQANADASQAETQFAAALPLHDQQQATSAATSYAQAIATLEQPVSRQSLEPFASGRSDFDRAIDALNRELCEQAEVQDVLRRYREAQQAAASFVQLLSLLEQGKATLLAGNVDDAHTYYSEAAVHAATSTIPAPELIDELWNEVIEGLDNVKAARQDPRTQQERAEVEKLKQEVDGLLESETIENYKQAITLLTRILRSPIVSNHSPSYQHYHQRRAEIEQHRDHLLALFNRVNSARQIEGTAAEMIGLRVLIDRGQSVSLNNESLSDRLANLSKQFVRQLLPKAGDYASQARTICADGMRNLDPERFKAATSLYQQAIELLQQPDLQPGQAEADEARPEEIKQAVAYLRQQLSEQQELRETIQRYRNEQRDLNRQTTRVQRARETHDLAIEDLNNGRREAAINRLKVAAKHLWTDTSPVIDQALDVARRGKIQDVISDLERTLIEARAAFAQGRSEEAAQHLEKIEDQGVQFPEDAAIREVLAQARVLNKHIHKSQYYRRELGVARPLSLAEYERLFSQLDELRALQPQSPDVTDLGAQIVRGAADIARGDALRAIKSGDATRLRTLRKQISVVARRLSDLPDEPPRSGRRREVEEALRRIQEALAPD